MRMTEYISGNSIEQTYRLHLLANRGLQLEGKVRMHTRIQYNNSKTLKNYFNMPGTLVDKFCESLKHNLGPFATDINLCRGYSFLFDPKIKICPMCIKEMKMPIYQTLRCFDKCLEHDIPLISNCPECGSKLQYRTTSPFLLCCQKCNTNYGECKPIEVIVGTHHQDNAEPLISKPKTDIRAWIIAPEEKPEEYKEIKSAGCFLRKYLSNGKRGKPDRRLYKTDIDQNISFEPSKRAEIRIKDKISNFEEESYEYQTLRIMRSCSMKAYRRMPPYTYQSVLDIHWNVPKFSVLDEKSFITSMNLSNTLEDMYEDAYYDLFYPVIRKHKYYIEYYKNILEDFPNLRYTFIVFETSDAFDIYEFYEQISTI